MTETYTIKDVTADLSFLMSLTKIFTVDDAGFWFDPGDDKRYVHRLDATENGKEIVMFQDPLPKGDFYFFNPFAEGFGRKSPAVQLFYKMTRIGFNLNLRTAILYMTRSVLESKEAVEAKNTDFTLSHVVVRMSSIPVEKRTTVYDLVDEKMLDEFEKLFDRMNDECIFVPYLMQQMTAKVKCDALEDPKWDEKFGKDIRKKSLLAFKAALMGVLGITTPQDLQKFSVKYDPETKSAARFHTTMLVFLKLYSSFNDILADAFSVNGVPSDRDEINLGELAMVIERFPLAYAIAKHMVQPVMPKNHPTDTTTIDTSQLKLGGALVPANSSTRRFPGPEIIDDMGRRTRASALPLTIGRREEPPRRFAPHVISDVPIDPFAPATRQVNTGFTNNGLGSTGGGLNFGGNQQQSYFNNGGPGFGGALNLSPPSNFGSPQVTRSYF